MPATAQPRTYQVRTFGCQMNVHDSERMSGMLEAAGYVPAAGELADVVVFNTCAVRENADNKLYGNLGILAPVKAANPGMQIAVGGCLAQKDRDTILKKAPWVDAVFGTHNVGALPALLERARHNNEAQLEILESLDVFPSTLPTKRDSVYSGWVSISVGCNNTCTFCIVPALRGKEKDRRPGDILAEIQALVDDGAIEVTLLGQNVNSYGVEFGDRQAFSKLLRACGDIPGLERVRFTSPHPAAFTDDVIDAMAETPNVMPQLHMPLQSGSDKVLKDMKRSYRSTKFLGILDKVREKIPHAAISTDIIVGFPGETEEDFQATLDVVEKSRFATAFTFQYSKRPGTPAAELPDQLPKAVVQERFERLTALQDRIAAEENARQLGRRVEVMVTAQSGRKSEETHRLSGPVPGPAPGPLLRAGRRRDAPPRRPRHRDHHRGRGVPPRRRPGHGGRLQPPPLARGRRLGQVPGGLLRRTRAGIRFRRHRGVPGHAHPSRPRPLARGSSAGPRGRPGTTATRRSTRTAQYRHRR